MKKYIISAIATVLLSACAAQKPVIWEKEGATSEQFGRDQMTCRQYGMQSAQANGLAGNLFVEMWISDEAGKCLNNLGYTRRQ